MTKLIALTIVLLSFGASARELKGVSLPDAIEIEGKKLNLNGMGVRQATFLKISVYVAGLYSERQLSSTEEAVADNGRKRLQLQFVRNVDKDDVVEVWEEFFKKACPEAGCPSFAAPREKLLAVMSDMKKGDSMIYDIAPQGVHVYVNDVDKGIVGDPAFGKLLIQAWLGVYAPNPELREGLLGK